MKKATRNIILIAGIIIAIGVIFMSLLPVGYIPNNELPMYGAASFEDHMELRPELYKKADDVFIQEVLSAGGTKEEASIAITLLGREFLEAGDTSTAIKRFNQAGLLNSNNPLVYWGFGSALIIQENKEEALTMFNLALEKEILTHEIESRGELDLFNEEFDFVKG